MITKLTTLSIVLSLLGGCSTIDIEKQQKANNEIAEIAQSTLKYIESGSKTPSRTSTIEGTYLGAGTIPVSRDKTLPVFFSKPLQFPVTLLSEEGRVNLSTVAERITKITGMSIEISPDVFLRSADVPSEKGGDGQKGDNQKGSNLAYDLEKNILMDYKGSLAQFLDMASTRLGITWEYRDSKLRLYRYATKTFEIHALAGTKEVNSEFNSSGQVKSKSGDSGSSSIINVSQKQNAKLEIWQSLIGEVKAYMSPGGKISANEAVGTITLTDTPQTIKQVAELLADQNRRMSRTVFFRVDLLSVSAKDGIELGLALNSVFTENNKQFTLKSPESLVSDAVGKISGAVLSPVKSVGSTPSDVANASKWAGSSVMINALKQVANVEIKNSLTATTINNSPVPLTMATTQSYVDSVGSSQGQSTTQITVEQKQITTGVFMQLLPRILDNNKLLLQYTLDISTLQGFESTVTPAATLKSPTVPRRSTSQTLKLNMGETAVLSAMDNLTINNGSSISFGGSYINSASKENILILITPIIVDQDAALEPGRYINIYGKSIIVADRNPLFRLAV